MREAIQVLPEETLREIVDDLVRLVEAAGAAVIFIGAVIGVVKFIGALPKRNPEEFVPVRLSLGRYLALGLEFQLASDVLRTAIAPSFTELGKLAAVAAIRTALNFFLAREIHEEREQVAEKQATAADSVYSRAVRAGTRAGLKRHAGIRAEREDPAATSGRDDAALDGVALDERPLEGREPRGETGP